jgi:hypothetical protein
MTTYYIRTTDPAALLALAVQIGLLRETEDGGHVMADPHAGIWDPIGPIYRPTGETVDGELGPVPVSAALADAEGRPYWHANLMLYTASLTEIAQAAYAAAPTVELGAALQSIPSYFVADADGVPIAPQQPARTWM